MRNRGSRFFTKSLNFENRYGDFDLRKNSYFSDKMHLKCYLKKKQKILGLFQAKNLFFLNNFFQVHFVTKVTLHF
jgi:hypothetical protein